MPLRLKFLFAFFLAAIASSLAAVRTVANVSELNTAVAAAAAGDEIVLQPGLYQLTRQIDLARAGLTIRGATGNREDVRLRGGGMNTRGVDEGISVSANDIAIRDLSLEEFYFNGIHTRAELDVDRCRISNVKTVNIGERHIKGSRDNNSATKTSDDFIIENVWMLQTTPRAGHTDTSPDYIGGIDMMAMKNLVIRDCRAEGIVGSANGGNAAIFLWQGIQNVTIERNRIIGCAKGIALGNPAAPAANLPTGAWHADGAIIRNNMVLRGQWTTGNNIGLELASAKNVNCAYNTFYSAQADYFRLISFSESPGGPNSGITLQYNLIRGRIYDLTTGAGWRQVGNLLDTAGSVIQSTWFAAPSAADFHLTPNATRAIDAGTLVPEAPQDFDREPRPDGLRPDLGADEFKSADLDNDTIPDRLERAPTPFAAGTDDRFVDTDNDGASNSEEFFAGTNPSDPASLLKIASPRLENAALKFTIPTTQGWRFNLHATPSLDTPAWSQAASFLGAGAPIEISEPIGAPMRIYRIEALPGY